MARHLPRIAAPFTALSLLACASTTDDSAATLADVEARHRAELHAFEAEQRRLASSLDLAEPLEFGPLGRVIVRDVELVGWPGNAFLRADFTWVNTGVRTRKPPLVQLTVWDPETDEGRAETLELVTTFGLEYGSGSTYTSWVEVPTEGIHTKSGWTWTLDLVAPDAEG